MTLQQWLDRELDLMASLFDVECLAVSTCGREPRDRYHWDGGTLEWGQNIPAEKLRALDAGELFVLMDQTGQPHSLIMRDLFGTIREKRIELQ